MPSSELQDLGAAAKERESRVLSLLSSLNLQHTCLLGDASTLAALRDLQALDRIPHVNTVHKYKPRGREQTICPPLMVAVAEGHRAVLELLLQHPLLDVDMPEANVPHRRCCLPPSMHRTHHILTAAASMHCADVGSG